MTEHWLGMFNERVVQHLLRVLHMAARLTRSSRATSLRLDRTWSWAEQLALAFTRLWAAFA